MSKKKRPADARVHVGKHDLTAASAPGEDFAAMLQDFGAPEVTRLQEGTRVSGKIFHITKESVFVSLSPSQEGTLATGECVNDDGELTVAVGDTLEAFVTSVDNGVILSRRLGRGEGGVAMLEQAQQSGMPVEGLVTAANKGGLEVAVAGARAFCPMGQVDINFFDNPEQFIGQTLSFMVREVRERGRNVVLSRRALQEAERAEAVTRLRETLKVGQVLPGRVTRTAKFGAFVDLGGVEGLVPMSELAHQHVGSAEDVCSPGDLFEVEIRSIEDDPKRRGQLRISLSRKATLADPWTDHAADLYEGATLKGRVAHLEAFGAFVEIFPGIRGLVHISEMSTTRVRHPQDLVQPDQEVTVRVLSFDPSAKRVSLSLKEGGPPTGVKEAGHGMQAGAAVEGTVERVESYGVFVKLNTGVTALLPAVETGTPRGTDMAKAYPVGTPLALEVLSQDDRGRFRVSLTARERRDEQTQVRDYNKTQGAAGLGTFADMFNKAKR